jgi:ppGpp synthetase/RelA/SpoT-type nucleotidyltranferase
LGDDFRDGAVSKDALILLDEYRRSFGDAYETVVSTLQNKLNLEPSGRPAKTTTSIRHKLQREKIRLTQMQDIAGCRVIVPNVMTQDRLAGTLKSHFTVTKVFDRRVETSHGYRAVHVVAYVAGKAIEIQIRSELQHVWAEVSEKLADVIDPAIKYGGGPEVAQTMLIQLSHNIGEIEKTSVGIDLTIEKVIKLENAPPAVGKALEAAQSLLVTLSARTRNLLSRIANELPVALREEAKR